MNQMQNNGMIIHDGFQLHYVIEGNGTPAIVIGSSIYYPRTFSQNLRKQLQLIFMDHRGFVQPPGPVDNSAFELNKLIDDIERLRKKLALDRIIIVGHSGHGYLALEYAKKYPQHVSNVVMIATAPNLSAAGKAAAEQYWQDSVWPERKAVHEKNLQLMAKELPAESDSGKRFIKYLILNGAKTWYDFNFDPSPLWNGVEVNIQMFDYVWGTIFRDIDIIKGLDKFDVPVFLALGRYDFDQAPPCSWNSIRIKFKNLTIRVFEHSGHTPQYEQPDLFDTELLELLQSEK